MALAASWLHGLATRLTNYQPRHDAVRASGALDDLRNSRVNIVHVRRRARSPVDDARLVMTAPRVAVALPPAAPGAAADALVACVADRELRTAIRDDVLLLARVVSGAAAAAANADDGGGGGAPSPSTLTAKLELIEGTSCPRWHTDTVGLRALVTYAGAGTEYLENR
jgi:hypothetical protein